MTSPKLLTKLQQTVRDLLDAQNSGHVKIEDRDSGILGRLAVEAWEESRDWIPVEELSEEDFEYSDPTEHGNGISRDYLGTNGAMLKSNTTEIVVHHREHKAQRWYTANLRDWHEVHVTHVMRIDTSEMLKPLSDSEYGTLLVLKASPVQITEDTGTNDQVDDVTQERLERLVKLRYAVCVLGKYSITVQGLTRLGTGG